MKDHRSTNELLTEFAKNPGAENSRLEFKSKEILETKEQKKKVIRILSAMANRSGGTMIIGVRHEDGGLLFQKFSSDSEWRQELTHIAQQYSSPQLQRFWDISFEECMGHQVLRIDVREVKKRLIKVDYKGEYQVWIRDEDGMREMTTGEIDQFYKRRVARQEADSGTLVETTELVDYKPKYVSTVDNSSMFSRRGVVRINKQFNVVFGSGIHYDYIRKAHTIHLRTTFPCPDGYADIPDVLNAAEHHLGARTDYWFGYSIRVSNFQLVGRSLKSLCDDLDRLGSICQRLGNGNESESAYGPVIIGVVPVDYGLLWFELQRETDRFTRSNLGIILQDVPFNDAFLNSFYEDIGTSPTSYSHKHGLQFVTLKGRQVGPLRNPRLTPLTEEKLLGPLYITADNPFYDWPEGMQSSLDNPLPDHLTEGIASIERVPFQVSGGYLHEDDDNFALNYLHFTKVQGIHPTWLVDAVCWQR